MSKMKMPSKATPFLYGLYKNNNEQMPKAFGKVYARPVVLSTLETEDIAEHMMEHGSLYGTDVIKGVLEKFYDCSLELLFQNRRIKLPGLGTLFLSFKKKIPE